MCVSAVGCDDHRRHLPRLGLTLNAGQHRRALHAVDFNRFNRLDTLFGDGTDRNEVHPENRGCARRFSR